tara:strand:+ start:64 stop:378 length:315 start_codon:yes stop_codon:yes gene_type:complete
MTDVEELEIYKKYKESVPRQKQIMQEMEEDLQEAKAILIDIDQELKDGNITQEEYKSIQESMQEIIDEVTANKPEQEKMLQHCEEFISLYEEKQQQESDQSFKN